jgi:hypothetical protein
MRLPTLSRVAFSIDWPPRESSFTLTCGWPSCVLMLEFASVSCSPVAMTSRLRRIGRPLRSL